MEGDMYEDMDNNPYEQVARENMSACLPFND